MRLTPQQWRELRLTVFERDSWTCQARVLNPKHHWVCHTKWGDAFNGVPHRNLQRVDQYLTLDHVLEGYGGMAMRAEHIEQQLVTVCWGAHLGMGPYAGRVWSTSKIGREKVRDHLRKMYDGKNSTNAASGTAADDLRATT